MLDTKEIDFDLDRCEKVLRENDYMEIVIAIEELQDKYRDKIDYIIENENNVLIYQNKLLILHTYHLNLYLYYLLLL